MARRLHVFVSYSHSDRKWAKRLRVHLRPLARKDRLELWDDSRITPGQLWRQEISQAIDRSAAAIMLVSADFLASEFIAEQELPPLLSRAETRGVRILPIFVHPCRVEDSDALMSFQAVNNPSQPLSTLDFAQQESVFVSVVSAVADVLKRSGSEKAVNRKDESESVSSALFEKIRFSSISLAMLQEFENHPNDWRPTFTELQSSVGAQSRKTAHAAYSALSDAGWVNKRNDDGSTRIKITGEGARQLQRLSAATAKRIGQ